MLMSYKKFDIKKITQIPDSLVRKKRDHPTEKSQISPEDHVY